ncbi:MAG: type IIL restriction-modification enzyme MmeI, partial [Anaerolineae bacterium]
MTDQPALIAPFIARWRASGAAERANCQPFLSELCDVLEVDRPNPTTPDEAANAYVFEKSVPLPHGATGRIDLYRRGCFVLEAKQGRDGDAGTPALSLAGQAASRARKRGTALRGAASWDTAMERARQQAQSYARNLPPAEVADGGRPPFLIVADVGDSLALYSEFTRSGGNYVPFPDPAHYRISLTDLADPDVRTLLRQLWLDPMSLDPSRRSARVTRDIADRLARLARALEGQHDPQTVAHFLMRCLFTMFAEDVGLLPHGSFTQLLADARHNVAHFPAFVQELWRTMAAGGFSLALRVPIKHFDGGLFTDASALPLSADQLQLLIEAAQADWRDVEPAIFGTLLERALDPAERHKLGAHFTPRAYVERLVLPTLVEPLRGEWEAVQAAAARLADEGEIKGALAEVEAFQRRLASVRVLDPACGTGNFLYVSLEHLVRLQAEVLEVRGQLGGSQMLLDVESVTVSPRQFLGLEISPRAAAIAELVLWIGYLQWRLRTEGDLGHIAEPIIRSFHNIECRDAVLAWDAVEPLLDAAGRPVTRWDGRTTRRHPVTGEQVPDETARVP